MIPGVYGFHWDAGHLIFLGAFYTALTLIFTTVLRSMMRARREIRGGRTPLIAWQADFHDLPERSRRCRHELTGEVASRECPNAFDCRKCSEHRKFAPAAEATGSFEVLGIDIPLDRLYHRGHTWVRSEEDGSLMIGLDGLMSRLLPRDSEAELPPEGTRLAVNAPAWTVRCGGEKMRILSPVNATVLSSEMTGAGPRLRVRLDLAAKLTHLLRGAEVAAWMEAEVERLERALSSAGVGVALADGGTLVEDPGAGYEEEAWAAARAEMLLEG